MIKTHRSPVWFDELVERKKITEEEYESWFDKGFWKMFWEIAEEEPELLEGIIEDIITILKEEEIEEYE